MLAALTSIPTLYITRGLPLDKSILSQREPPNQVKEVFQMQNKIDFESVRFSLDNIVSTLGLVMEDIEQEHLDFKDGLEENFFKRMDSVFIPALNLIHSTAFDLLEDVKEATA